MNQINAFHGVVLPNVRAQSVRPQKDSRQRRQWQHERPADQEADDAHPTPDDEDDRNPHVDIKA